MSSEWVILLNKRFQIKNCLGLQMYRNTDPDFSTDKKIRFLFQRRVADWMTQLGNRNVNKVLDSRLETAAARIEQSRKLNKELTMSN